jgi:hypothetical protein
LIAGLCGRLQIATEDLSQFVNPIDQRRFQRGIDHAQVREVTLKRIENAQTVWRAIHVKSEDEKQKARSALTWRAFETVIETAY